MQERTYCIYSGMTQSILRHAELYEKSQFVRVCNCMILGGIRRSCLPVSYSAVPPKVASLLLSSHCAIQLVHPETPPVHSNCLTQ